jgi:hypothetical protein
MRKVIVCLVLFGVVFLVFQLQAAQFDCSSMIKEIENRTKLEEALACLLQGIKNFEGSTWKSDANILLPYFPGSEHQPIPGSKGAAFCAIAEVKSVANAESWCLVTFEKERGWTYNLSPQNMKCSARCLWITLR